MFFTWLRISKQSQEKTLEINAGETALNGH